MVTYTKNDEWYTPAVAIKPILKYLKPASTIWCPFDTEQSLFVKELREAGHTVIHTHISTGGDFFNLSYPCDYIISNPPFSQKTAVLNRLFALKIPFAILLGIPGLFDHRERSKLFRENPFEILYLSPRVAYFTDYNNPIIIKSPSFQSIYICSQVLPKQILFATLSKNGGGL